MSHNKYVRDPEQTVPGQSQDALRHEEDARHGKRHKIPLPGVVENADTSPQQPETPKVGSNDAPGG